MSQTPSSSGSIPAAATTPAQAPAPTSAPAAGAAPAKTGNEPPPRPMISIDDFLKIDLRIAKILHAEPHPNADKLFKLQLDDGSGTPRQICAGIRAHYTADQLIGKSIVIVANLAPRMLRGEESRGMLLAASSVPKDGEANVERQVIILSPAGDIAPGSTVG